jgi:hypothetical protein
MSLSDEHELDLQLGEEREKNRALTAELTEAKRDLARLRGFAQDLLTEWPNDIEIDGFELQELCVKHRLLIATYPPGPCGEDCWCQGYYGNDRASWKNAVCYRKTDLLLGYRPSAQNKIRVSGVPYEVDLSEGGDHD